MNKSVRLPLPILALSGLLCGLTSGVSNGQTQVPAQASDRPEIQSAAASFEGFTLQASVGYQPHVANVTNVGIRNTNRQLSGRTIYNQSVPFILSAGYTWSIGESATIGTQIEFNPINQQVGITILPGYAFTTELQGYLKLGGVVSRVSIDQGPNRDDTAASINGAMVGLGIKQMWTQNLYGFAEMNYLRFGSFGFTSWRGNVPIHGTSNISAYNAMVGVGYRF